MFNVTDSGFQFNITNFVKPYDFTNLKQDLVSIIDHSASSDTSFLISYESLYNYRNHQVQSTQIDARLFELKIPSYSYMHFEFIHQGQLHEGSFRIRLIKRNNKDEEVVLKKLTGPFYESNDGTSYFLTPKQSEFLVTWVEFNENLKSGPAQKSRSERLKAYSKLSEAYRALNLVGNSYLDTYVVNFVESFEYNLVGNEDGSWDIIPSFEKNLEKYNLNINALPESANEFSSNLLFKDRKKRQQVHVVFSSEGEKAWKEFYNLKKLPPAERTKALKEGQFIDQFAPKEIVGSLFSEKIIGFTLETPAQVRADAKSMESWSEGLDDQSNLLRSISGSAYEVTLTPAPELYGQIRDSIDKLQEKIRQEEQRIKSEPGAVLNETDVSELKVYIEELKDDFHLKELETFASRIENQNKPQLQSGDIEHAKALLQHSYEKNSHFVEWEDQDQNRRSIPTKALEKAINEFQSEERETRTVNVQIADSKTIDVNQKDLFSNDWFMKYQDQDGPIADFKDNVKLRPHQKQGFAWLRGIATDENIPVVCRSRGALLADDMGLGKTIQVIRLIVEMKKKTEFSSMPILIVAPLNLLKTSWKADGLEEFLSADFVDREKIIDIKTIPSLPRAVAVREVLRLEAELTKNPDIRFSELEISSEVQAYINRFKKSIGSSIVLTSYETLRSRIFELASVNFSLVVLDEAQKIKNQNTGQSAAAKALKAFMKVAMTGTPIENSIIDLWNICEFAVPGYMGSIDEFRKQFQHPISLLAPGSQERKDLANRLENKLSPIWLRRTKKEIFRNGEIPPIEHFDSCKDENGNVFNQHLVPMSDQQADIFKAQVGYFNSSKGGFKVAAIRNMLEACYAPWWNVPITANYNNIEKLFSLTPKLKLTFDILESIYHKSEKVILFVNILDLQQDLSKLIHDYFNQRFGKSIDCEVFNGELSLTEREAILKRFKLAVGFKAIIISPRSGGAGLNLTQANHVIHYTREWNPAVERQATDRAYRMGQAKPVYVYYPTSSLIHMGIPSAEEHLASILQAKREVIDDFTVSQTDTKDIEESFENYKIKTGKTRLTWEGVVTLTPTKFELLAKKYFESRGYKVDHVGGPGDRRCDLVCTGPDDSLLVQVKFTQRNAPQGNAAVNDIRASQSYYEQTLGRSFNLVAITNASFNEDTHAYSKIGEPVQLVQGDAIAKFLRENHINIEEL